MHLFFIIINSYLTLNWKIHHFHFIPHLRNSQNSLILEYLMQLIQNSINLLLFYIYKINIIMRAIIAYYSDNINYQII